MISLSIIWPIIKNWWWILLPVILFFVLKFIYSWWIRWDVWYKKNHWILLEVKPPAEILKPFKAMEDIFTVLWGIYDMPIWREIWCEGEFPHFPYWLSCEVASIGGEVHFYLRILKEWKDMVESTIYSYYPEAEISVVEDYTKNVPQNIPNEKWDLYGEDFTLQKDDVYPIKTYSMFFEEKPEVAMEEKRIDPMNSLLEALIKLQPGEQFWFQIGAIPIQNKDIPFIDRGREMANKLAKRPETKKPKPMWQEAAEVLVTGKPAEEPKEEAGLIAPELRLTPGEKEILKAIETKMEKYCFNCWIRILYVYKKDEPHFIGNYKIGRSFLGHTWTSHLNGLRFSTEGRTKIHYWLRARRLYLRKRRHLRYYVERLPLSFPWNFEGRLVFPPFYPRSGLKRTVYVLSSEELATIFHFPAKVVPPTVPKVEAKKAGPPAGLPME
jgi:hypothetical protein